MRKVNTLELAGSALDYAVALHQFNTRPSVVQRPSTATTYVMLGSKPFMPTADWHDAGPLIEKYSIQLVLIPGKEWVAMCSSAAHKVCVASHRKVRVAAMRAYVLAHLGSEVEIPDELQSECERR